MISKLNIQNIDIPTVDCSRGGRLFWVWWLSVLKLLISVLFRCFYMSLCDKSFTLERNEQTLPPSSSGSVSETAMMMNADPELSLFPADCRLFEDSFSAENTYRVSGHNITIHQYYCANLGVSASVWDSVSLY